MPKFVTVRLWVCGMVAILVCGLISMFCFEWAACDLQQERVELLRARHEARLMLRQAIADELDARAHREPVGGLVSISAWFLVPAQPSPPTFSWGPSTNILRWP